MKSILGTMTAVALTLSAGSAMAAQGRGIDPNEFGVLQAPVAGSEQIPLENVPLVVQHAAKVAFKDYNGTINSAQIDRDEIKAVWELKGTSSDGRALEADIDNNGNLLELEVQIRGAEVPAKVRQALVLYAPNFNPSNETPAIEKSIRPSEAGLPEIWYEFSGVSFDVEITSDGSKVLIEPA